MFLDLGLEAYMRGLTEKVMGYNIGFDNYLKEGGMILSNLLLSYHWNELAICKEEWDNIVMPCSKQMSEDNARKLKSVVDRVK